MGLSSIVLAATLFAVEPLTLYRTENAADVQFYDAEGRSLFVGANKGAKLVASPADAVGANVKLEPVTVDWNTPCPIDDPAFWCETSKVIENTGDHLKVGSSGYAISIPVPPIYDFRCTPDAADTRKGVHSECMNRIWYDRDLRELAMNNSRHLETYQCPTNAAYVRFLIPWSRYDNFRECRLVPARFYTSHPYASGKGGKFADRFKGGTTNWHPGEVVLKPGADCREVFAAAELVREVKTITGKRLPIVNAPTINAAFHIRIGRAFAAEAGILDREPKLAAKLKGTDGYAVIRKGKDIYAFGDTPRGTILATVKLLECVSDFYWWRPNRDCGLSFTPQATLDFAHVKDAVDVPVFPRRSFTYGGNPCSPAYDDWAVRHYFFRGYHPPRAFTAQHYHAKSHGFYAQIGDNFLGLVFNHGAEAKEEWWPMINKQRQIGTRVGQPCYSNPEVVAETVRSVNKILDDPPEEWDSFCFDYSDSWLCCECPECLKPITLPDGRVQECKHMLATKDPHFRSTRTYMVANEVAKAVASRYPDKPVTMLAYIYTAPKPEVKLHPAIRVSYATYDTTTMRFPTREQDRPVLYAPEGWAQRTERWCREEPQAIGMYEYFFTAAPAMFAEAAATNLQQMADAGGWGVHSQTQWDDNWKSAESFGKNSQMWDINAMDQVLIAALFWNPYQDVDALRSEFLKRVYGEGAADMEEYYRLFRQRWFDRSYPAWMNCHTPCPDVYTRFIIEPRIEQKLYDCITRASRKTSSAAAKRHLEGKLQTLKEMRAATGLAEIPGIPEMASEWQDATSPQWNRAFTLDPFRDALPDPDDPVQMSCDLVKTPPALSKTTTRVDLACDRNYLYWRVTPDDKGGYTEFIFPRGKPWKFHRFFTQVHGGVETGRIPMGAIRATPTNVITYIVRRFDAKGNCSFGRAAANKTRAFPGENWRSFSTLDPAVESVIDPADAKLGLNAKPPLTFPDPEIDNHPLKKLFSFSGRGDGGQAMRRVRGVPAYDTGYGSGFVHGLKGQAGDKFLVTGDRWRYGGFAPVAMWFFDEKGAKIRDTAMPGEESCRDGPFVFKVSCPDGTVSCSLMIYDSYVKELKIEKVE